MKTGKRFRYTPEQILFLREGFASMSRHSLTEAFNARFGTNRSIKQIEAYLRNHRIRSGRTGRFVKGHAAWNLGKKGFMGPNITSFQPGHMPRNKRRLWSERITRDGYIEISIPERNPHTGAPNRWKLKHVWLWEMKHGAVPKGHVLIFKDGDRLNCDIDNLLLIKRMELLSLNLHNYRGTNSELKPSVLALARLEAKARIRTRPGRGRRGKEHKETPR